MAPVKVTDQSFATDVLGSTAPVVVDFWAEWCGPCRFIAPALEEIATEMDGQVKIAKLNVDENPQAASRFAVQAIPTMILFRGPLVVEQIRGAVPKQTIEAVLNRAV